MPRYFTQAPTVFRVYDVTEGNLEACAAELTSDSDRTVTVVDGALQWIGLEAMTQRAEPGSFVTLNGSMVPVIAEGDPVGDTRYQECPEGALYAFETPTAG